MLPCAHATHIALHELREIGFSGTNGSRGLIYPFLPASISLYYIAVTGCSVGASRATPIVHLR